jgi:hypothetical protein
MAAEEMGFVATELPPNGVRKQSRHHTFDLGFCSIAGPVARARTFKEA